MTPNIAGSVIPSKAEIPAAEATPFNFLFCLMIKNAAKAAPPCAIFDIVAIGKINEPPVLVASAINVVSTAIKLWCIPVMTIGAYNKPNISPPIAPPNSYIQVNPSDNQ